ncbi:MAG TPA: hypothetical protein VLF41_02410 [Candidatus Nanoarchaeia archaeon]|nr:hypothetical protein [Candidatus Nanoarchaeia archaeon]
MSSYQLILIVIAALTLINLATLGWVALLQKKLRQDNQAVSSTQKDLNQLKQEAHNVMLAETLIELESSANQSIQGIFDKAAAEFTTSLQKASAQITEQMQTGASQLVQQELEQYKETLGNLREAASGALGQINDALEKQKATLTADLEVEVKKQQQVLIEKFENKISDVVSAYLVESLGNDVDLGAQSQYLFKMLEEHKGELKQEILGGEPEATTG